MTEKKKPTEVKPLKKANTPSKSSKQKKPISLVAKVETVTSKSPQQAEDEIFRKEYWNGDSRDGVLVNGDGYHYYRMSKSGKILEAYEYYETDDGREFVSPLPEMLNIHWLEDLGFEDFDALDVIKEYDFQQIKEISISGSTG